MEKREGGGDERWFRGWLYGIEIGYIRRRAGVEQRVTYQRLNS